jgi:hypothetical protein
MLADVIDGTSRRGGRQHYGVAVENVEDSSRLGRNSDLYRINTGETTLLRTRSRVFA